MISETPYGQVAPISWTTRRSVPPCNSASGTGRVSFKVKLSGSFFLSICFPQIWVAVGFEELWFEQFAREHLHIFSCRLSVSHPVCQGLNTAAILALVSSRCRRYQSGQRGSEASAGDAVFRMEQFCLEEVPFSLCTVSGELSWSVLRIRTQAMSSFGVSACVSECVNSWFMSER